MSGKWRPFCLGLSVLKFLANILFSSFLLYKKTTRDMDMPPNNDYSFHKYC